jgi:surface antigen
MLGMTMILRPLTLAFVAVFAAMSVSPAFAEADGQKKGLFGFIAKADDNRSDRNSATKADMRAAKKAEKADKKAERKARREARKADTPSAKPAHQDDAKRAEVKAGVAHAVANRPKGRLWCVPFARTVSGVDIRGNAHTWWGKAKGVYERGHEPRVGAVIAFSASRAMRNGHVGVVSKVVSDREILVDQANWERNRVTQDTLVVDVSSKGDWSQVKVANPAGSLGRVNPVSGFIYN